MRHAKSGQWWNDNPQRALANNSGYVTQRNLIWVSSWMSGKSLYDSKSGERGIFNRHSANKQVERTGRRVVDGYEFGTNPCSEIILRDREFCNLSEVVVRASDTREKVY